MGVRLGVAKKRTLSSSAYVFGAATTSFLQHVLQEVLKPRLGGVVDDVGAALFYDYAAVHEHDLVGDFAGEAISWVTHTMVMPSLAKNA